MLPPVRTADRRPLRPSTVHRYSYAVSGARSTTAGIPSDLGSIRFKVANGGPNRVQFGVVTAAWKGAGTLGTHRQIIALDLGPGGDDTFETTFRGVDFRVRRVSVRTPDALYEAAQTMEADAFAVGRLEADNALPTPALEAARSRILRTLAERTTVPIVTGKGLQRLGEEWSIRHIQFKFGDSYFNNTRALFLSGRRNEPLAKALNEYTDNLQFADPLFDYGHPGFLTSMAALKAYPNALRSWGRRAPGAWVSAGIPRYRRALHDKLRRAVREAFVLVMPDAGFGASLELLTPEDLKDKIVITSAATDDRVASLRERGVTTIIDTTPMLLPDVRHASVLEALITFGLDWIEGTVTQDDLLEVISDEQLVPRVVYPSGKPVRKNRFAFVIHPLSQEHLSKVKTVKALARFLPKGFLGWMEKIVAYAPPWNYSTMTGIESPAGVDAEGWLITVGGTPRQMLSHSPEFTYRRLLAAARMAKKQGAQIMGLGAFTKVVGDAGVTVAKRAGLPITTGNSYSASGALWAAADAARRMGLLKIERGKRLHAKVMVVGATGAIGSVCCRLLSYAFEEIYMVDVRDARLLALRESILEETPDVNVQISTRADRHLADMDVIVTATSGAGKTILDIMQVKPGCIITDVARPLDLPSEAVAKRPDVLVIESGEILVPGENPRFKDIGLPPNVVYACLAETIVLALEGRYETYTIGRNIEWEKVREIYQLGLKHGMRLAAISGVNGVFTDEDIARVRELALEERARRGMPVPD